MFQLTKRTEYGLIALAHMVDREGEFVSAREICERFPVPRRLVAQVLQDLARAELVDSQRGSQGGYTLRRSPDAITLGEIVVALEGPPTLTSCEQLPLAGHNGCEVEPTCPIRSPMHRIRSRIWDLMERTSLRSIAHPEPTLALGVGMGLVGENGRDTNTT
jgi:Rrf2 family protein